MNSSAQYKYSKTPGRGEGRQTSLSFRLFHLVLPGLMHYAL